MAEEGGGGHGDSGSCSAAGSAQRQPPPPPPQAPQPGSQAPAAPALAPDHLPQNNTLVALPIVAIENILSFMSYDEISQLRLVRPPRRPGPVPRGTPRLCVPRAAVWGGPARAARSWGGSPGDPRRAGAGCGARRCCPGRPAARRRRLGVGWGGGERCPRPPPQPGTRPPGRREVTELGWVPAAPLSRDSPEGAGSLP